MPLNKDAPASQVLVKDKSHLPAGSTIIYKLGSPFIQLGQCLPTRISISLHREGYMNNSSRFKSCITTNQMVDLAFASLHIIWTQFLVVCRRAKQNKERHVFFFLFFFSKYSTINTSLNELPKKGV